MTIRVSGIRTAQSVLDDALREINLESELMINVILQGISSSTMPYVPVDTSNLINSEVRQTEATPQGSTGFISFFATTEDGKDYAIFTHEGGPKNWQKPGASDRYLEFGVRDFIRDDLASVIARFQS